MPLPLAKHAPTRAEFDAALTEALLTIPTDAHSRAVEPMSKLPMPPLAPAYSTLAADPEGYLWIQLTPRGSIPVDFLVVRPNGQEVARLRIPALTRIYEIGRDYVLGLYSDADEELHLVAYRLTR